MTHLVEALTIGYNSRCEFVGVRVNVLGAWSESQAKTQNAQTTAPLDEQCASFGAISS